MNRADAYAVLSRELESWRHRPYEQLVALVGQPESERTVRVGQEDVTVRVAVRWANEKKATVRVEALPMAPVRLSWSDWKSRSSSVQASPRRDNPPMQCAEPAGKLLVVREPARRRLGH